MVQPAAREDVLNRLDFVRALLANSAKGAPTACPQACCCVSVSPTDSLTHISPAVYHDLIASVVFEEIEGVPFEDAKVFVNSAQSAASRVYEFLFDSGSDHHILTLEAAIALFRDKHPSHLRVMGVSGQHTSAELQGHLIIAVEDSSTGETYRIDLGEAHGMRECPVNLLSISLLLKAGCAVHFEAGNCWFQPQPGAPRIPFVQRSGLFQLLAEDGSDFSPSPSCTQSYVVNGSTFGAAADIKLWHKRMRHAPVDKLLRIFKHNLVQGFKVSGRMSTYCDCDSCKQANIRRVPAQNIREVEDVASYFGHTFSADIKEVPFLSFRGFRWVLCFVDHFSRHGFCYFVSSKTEITAKLRQFVNDMARHGVRIGNIQTDRGSEFFSQEGTSQFELGRKQHQFTAYCEAQHINHILHPVEGKAKLAERWFLEHFTAADVMLWEGRLSPAFWPDAVAYSMHLYNITPNDHLGGNLAPSTVLTGQPPRWDKIRLFGCDCYEHIPNDPYAKVPGIPKGRKLIFVGLTENMLGYRVFDPESRRYWTTSNLYFYESFHSRIDALRHHDQRRALLKKGIDQPVVMDDFADVNSQSVRNLYLDPDATPAPDFHSTQPLLADGGAREVPSLPSSGGAHGMKPNGAPIGGVCPQRTSAERATDEIVPTQQQIGPHSKLKAQEERARQAALRDVILRPVRLLAIGKEQKYTPEDKAFLDYVVRVNAPLVYQSPCPKNTSKPSGRRYLKYMHAKTIREAFELGATREDFLWDYRRAWIYFPKYEPDITGHIF